MSSVSLEKTSSGQPYQELSRASKISLGIFVISTVACTIILALAASHNIGSSTIFTASLGSAAGLTGLSAAIFFGTIARGQTQKSALATQLRSSTNFSAFIQTLQMIPAREKSQEGAKTQFSQIMGEVLGSNVSFPKPPPISDLDKLTGKLDQKLFHLSTTQGVENDVAPSSGDEERMHVWQAASQYNAAEADKPMTPRIGEAMSASQCDRTQGPLCQRTNPQAFELVTAFLTHGGFNMLDQVLPSAGKTYEVGAAIEHGYLRPSNANIEALTNAFRANYSKAEYVCYSSIPQNGKNPVYILLQAAPAIANAKSNGGLTENSDELEKYAALANYLALFQKGIDLAKETGKPVLLHATAVGGGVFGNQTQNIQWGFEKAALALQDEMKKTGVSVQLEAFNGTGPLVDIAKEHNIPTKDRME